MKKDNTNKIKSKNGVLTVLIVFVCAILVLYALSLFFVFGWGLLTSFKSAYEFNILKNYLGLPDVSASREFWNFTSAGSSLADKYGEYNIFMNYKFVIQSFKLPINPQTYYSSLYGEIGGGENFTANFGHYILNTVLYALGGAFFSTFSTMTMAFLTNKYTYKFSKFINVLFLVMMTIPFVGTTVSTMSLLKDIGIYDTYWAMFLMAGASCGGLYYFVFFGFYQGLSSTFIEAAEIDGASQLSTFIRIIIPLSIKTFGTIYLIQFVALWNTYEAIYLYFPSQPTFAYAIWRMSENTQGVGNVNLQSTCSRVAGCMILAVPVFILFLCLRKIIMGNLTLGGIKE